MAPPPSQAGKFKPRKPAKKIKVPGSTGTTASSSAGGTSSSAPTQSSSAAASTGGGGEGSSRRGNSGKRSSSRDRGGRGGRSNEGGRGSGRGGRGRGGRGRGGAPLPRGAVFFSGITKPTSTASSSRSAVSAGHAGRGSGGGKNSAITPGSALANIKRRQEQSGGDEVVVGELDVEIGASKKGGKSTILSRSRDYDEADHDDPDEGGAETWGGRPGKGSSIVDTYDSDSSVEEGKLQKHRRQKDVTQPTELPFPTSKVPMGIGFKQNNNINENDPYVLYECQKQDHEVVEEKKSTDDGDNVKTTTSSNDKDPPLISPFIDWTNSNEKQRKREEESLFLIQLPTRLPPITTESTIEGRSVQQPDMVMSIEDDNELQEQQDQLMPDHVSSLSAPTDQITSPQQQKGPSTKTGYSALNAQHYDDTLRNAGSGRLGKILVYKSGRTVLVLGDDNTNSNAVKMNITEGLPCGFVQQAVAIDINDEEEGRGNYVPIGTVKKTVIIKPDVESALS